MLRQVINMLLTIGRDILAGVELFPLMWDFQVVTPHLENTLFQEPILPNNEFLSVSQTLIHSFRLSPVCFLKQRLIKAILTK